MLEPAPGLPASQHATIIIRSNCAVDVDDDVDDEDFWKKLSSPEIGTIDGSEFFLSKKPF